MHFPCLSLAFSVFSTALPYLRLVVLLLVHICCSISGVYIIIDHSVYYHKNIQLATIYYNSSWGTSCAGGTGGSSTIMLVTVSIGPAGDNVSISERDREVADAARLVKEAKLPHIVSVGFELQQLYPYLNTEAASVVTLVAMDAVVLVTLRSPRSKVSSTALAFRGMKRVQNKAIRIPRSITRCFRMKRTTRKKNTRPAMMRSLSIRSAFSRAVTSCFEVVRMLSRAS